MATSRYRSPPTQPPTTPPHLARGNYWGNTSCPPAPPPVNTAMETQTRARAELHPVWTGRDLAQHQAIPRTAPYSAASPLVSDPERPQPAVPGIPGYDHSMRASRARPCRSGSTASTAGGATLSSRQTPAPCFLPWLTTLWAPAGARPRVYPAPRPRPFPSVTRRDGLPGLPNTRRPVEVHSA